MSGGGRVKPDTDTIKALHKREKGGLKQGDAQSAILLKQVLLPLHMVWSFTRAAATDGARVDGRRDGCAERATTAYGIYEGMMPKELVKPRPKGLIGRIGGGWHNYQPIEEVDECCRAGMRGGPCRRSGTM